MSKLDRVNALLAKPIQWPIAKEAVRLIATEEDCRLSPYLCMAGVWTCGWGETAGVVPGKKWSQDFADQRLQAALREYSAEVEGMLKLPATDEQMGALVSLAYNTGLGALRKSTVVRLHNAGDVAGAARAFGLWNKAKVNGQLMPLAGLTARRAAEAALYLRPDPEAPSERSVQAVAPESSLAISPIAQGGAVTAGAGAMSIVGMANDQLGSVGGMLTSAKGVIVETLGVPMQWLVPVLLLGVGAVIVWQRVKQRRSGWA